LEKIAVTKKRPTRNAQRPTPKHSRAQRALECGGSTPLSNSNLAISLTVLALYHLEKIP
jgi:hypothetical protein